MLFKSSKKISMVFLILVCTMQASLAYSVTDERTTLQTKKPHDVLEQVTSELLETIDVHRETFSNDPEAFFDELDRLLVNVIDFDWIAYRVMGKYAKKSSVVYSMSLTRTGSWKVTNLVINGINLGKIFRNQFTQRARKLEGNVDKVIDTWSSSSK